jgi:hypothetical protein
MRRRGPAIVAAAALAALPAAWYLGSPWWTLWRLRDAARAGDPARIASHVDLRAIAARAKRDGLAGWTSVLTTLRPDSDRNRAFIALAKRRLAEPPPSEAAIREDIRPWLADMPIRFAGLGGHTLHRPYIVHRGLDGFEVRDEDASPEFGPVLAFRRQGLGWKLAAVRFGQQ